MAFFLAKLGVGGMSSSKMLNPNLGPSQSEASSISPSEAVSLERFQDSRKRYAERNEARLFALRVVRDPLYQENVLSRARQGNLPPAVETRLMEYAWGKPTETIEISSQSDDLSSLPTGMLLEKARSLAIRVAALEIEESASLSEDKRKLIELKLQEETDKANGEKIN
jgi:hypothetical protein